MVLNKFKVRKSVITLVQRFSKGKEDTFKAFQQNLDQLLGVDAMTLYPPTFQNAPTSVQEWVLKIMSATDFAISEYGRHTFYDKGPDEVMGIGTFSKELKILPPEEAGARLEALAVCGADYERVAGAILSRLDDTPSDWWEACCGVCLSVDY